MQCTNFPVSLAAAQSNNVAVLEALDRHAGVTHAANDVRARRGLTGL